MGLRHQYTVTLYDDNGTETEAVIQVGDRHDILVIQRMLEYSLDSGESIEIEPDPFGQVDDIRCAFGTNRGQNVRRMAYRLTDTVTDPNDAILYDTLDVVVGWGGEDI